jgi:hypothetical protein
VEEARAVLRRLDRIDRLERAGAAPTELLGEVRALLGEAERWARRDRADVDDTLDRCRDALASRGRELVDQPV